MEDPESLSTPFNQGIDRLRRAIWSIEEIDRWYGTSMRDDPRHLEAQYRIFESRYPEESRGVVGQSVNRFLLELLFQERELIPARQAGVQMGMSLESFQVVLGRLNDEGFIHLLSTEVYRGVVSRNFVSGFHKNFEDLRHAMFGSYSSYVQRLHASIQQTLGVDSVTLVCETSRLLQDNPLDPAFSIDILTGEPMAICYQVYLENGKPGSLLPDACSWKTFVLHEAEIDQIAMGRVIERMGDTYRRLHNVLGY